MYVNKTDYLFRRSARFHVFLHAEKGYYVLFRFWQGILSADG